MRLSNGILPLLPTFVTSSPLLSPPPSSDFTDQTIDALLDLAQYPSIHESTLQARRILNLHGISTLSSVFPTNLTSPARVPPSVAGAAIGLMDYHASCTPRAYDPVLIAVTIATTMRNAAAGSNVTLSMRYHLPDPPSPRTPPDPWAYLAANLPRFSLVGYLERIPEEEVMEQRLDKCFFAVHPDAMIWAPGGEIEPHEAWWARLVVQELYFFGGFGDRARIGWLPIEEWRGIDNDEVERYRMIGEEGWEEAQAEYQGHRTRVDVGAQERLQEQVSIESR